MASFTDAERAQIHAELDSIIRRYSARARLITSPGRRAHYRGLDERYKPMAD